MYIENRMKKRDIFRDFHRWAVVIVIIVEDVFYRPYYGDFRLFRRVVYS